MIPTLLLRNGGLVKTVRFRRDFYLGDPINTVRIFNEKEVDELVVLDIDATRERRAPAIRVVEDIAGECFMPLAYGGGVTQIEEVAQILHAGAEKVVLNSALMTHPKTIEAAAGRFGSQSIVVSIDVGRTLLRGRKVYTHGGTRVSALSPVAAALRAVELGAGELLINSIDRDGTYKGYDIDLIRSIAAAVPVPVIACGGARNIDDFLVAIRDGHASAVAAGSLFVFQGIHRAVLVNFPELSVLENHLFRPLSAATNV